VAFQRAWVAYLWARAAHAGITPHIAQQRAEQWAHALLSADSSQQHVSHAAPPMHDGATIPGSHTMLGMSAAAAQCPGHELCELSAAMLELSRQGVEQKLWQLRCAAPKGA
jgi:hypothetical protein